MDVKTLKTRLETVEKSLKEIEMAFQQLLGQKTVLEQLIKEEENGSSKG